MLGAGIAIGVGLDNVEAPAAMGAASTAAARTDAKEKRLISLPVLPSICANLAGPGTGVNHDIAPRGISQADMGAAGFEPATSRV